MNQESGQRIRAMIGPLNEGVRAAEKILVGQKKRLIETDTGLKARVAPGA